MFVSYKLKEGFGYMCIGQEVNVWDNLLEFIRHKTHDQEAKLIYAHSYSNHPRHYVWIYTDGVYRTEDYFGPLKDVGDVDKLYKVLHEKYGFTNILGFIPNEIY